MFYRQKFVTNSSSTSFIAWGYVIPKELCPKYHDDGFYDILYEGDGDHCAGSTDDTDHIIIYANDSYIDTEDYVTVGLGQGGESHEDWDSHLREFAKKLGAELGNLAPGWFYTHHSS